LSKVGPKRPTVIKSVANNTMTRYNDLFKTKE